MDRLVAFSRRRRRWLLLVAAGAAAGLGAYKIYHHPAVAARRRRLVRLAAAVAAFADAAASSADAAALVASDLADFVRSDSDEVPRSVAQLAKLAAAPEVSASVSALSEAVTAGILRGAGSSASSPVSGGGGVALSERLVDKLFSEPGERLASAVAGSFARHLVLAYYSVPSPPEEASSPTMWVNVVTSTKCRKAISTWVEVFVSAAVKEFIEKTIHINTYEQLFEGLTNPKHDAKVKELLVSVCNGAVETLVKTTHHVMYNTGDNFNTSGNDNSSGGAREGWVETVSSTLAVPSNRKFVLDVTGRVTFETVRSFLEFVLWKLQDGARKGGDSVADSGLRVVRKPLEHKYDVILTNYALQERVLHHNIHNHLFVNVMRKKHNPVKFVLSLFMRYPWSLIFPVFPIKSGIITLHFQLDIYSGGGLNTHQLSFYRTYSVSFVEKKKSGFLLPEL